MESRVGISISNMQVKSMLFWGFPLSCDFELMDVKWVYMHYLIRDSIIYRKNVVDLHARLSYFS